MHIVGIIPARMGSSRFPGKPIAKICGVPMMEHIYKRAMLAKCLDGVYCATCDTEIKSLVESFGGKAVMTKDTHERASDRVAEAMLKIEAETGKKIDIVVMIQGDEPMLVPEMIEEAIQPMLQGQHIQVTNLMSPLKTKDEQADVNEVKVVVDKNNNAMYFSREPIPSWKKGAKDVPMFKQVCIIPFRRDFLIKFNELEPTPLEIVESVDMLRILENGDKVKMVPTRFETYSVDTLEDLHRVEKLMRDDVLMRSYAR